MTGGTSEPAGQPCVAAAMRGDTEAVRALWQEQRRWIAAVLLAHKPAYADLDDLLQDVAMALVRSISELRDQKNAKAWLRTVAINAARAAARPGKNRPHLRLADANVQPEVDSPDRFVAADEETRKLMEKVAELPDGYREPLLLRAVRGLSAKQIGELMGLSEMAVENRIARGRRMLRDVNTKKEMTPEITTSLRDAAVSRGAS